jgi:hypothetical protein
MLAATLAMSTVQFHFKTEQENPNLFKPEPNAERLQNETCIFIPGKF